jgi:hypothetical protein
MTERDRWHTFTFVTVVFVVWVALLAVALGVP